MILLMIEKIKSLYYYLDDPLTDAWQHPFTILFFRLVEQFREICAATVSKHTPWRSSIKQR